MKILTEHKRFKVCEGYGQYLNKRYEIWEDDYYDYDPEIFGTREERWKSRLGYELRFHSKDKKTVLNHFEEIKDEPKPQKIYSCSMEDKFAIMED